LLVGEKGMSGEREGKKWKIYPTYERRDTEAGKYIVMIGTTKLIVVECREKSAT
jgi:hypothetical protein